MILLYNWPVWYRRIWQFFMLNAGGLVLNCEAKHIRQSITSPNSSHRRNNTYYTGDYGLMQSFLSALLFHLI